MADFYDSISPKQAALIAASPLFFVASADPQLTEGPDGVGAVNLSPKGGVRLHVLSPKRLAYLDFRGSGNETIRHASAGGPVTLMVCSFEPDDAAIVRLYGTARATPLDESPLAETLLAPGEIRLSAPGRQVVEFEVNRTMTSCGYDVPVLEWVAERGREGRGRRYK